MALINCPECGKKISDESNACPHCGYPKYSQRYEPQSTSNFYGKQNKEEVRGSYAFRAIIVIFSIGFLLVVCKPSDSEYQETSQQNTPSSPTAATSSKSQPQTIANRFPNLQNVEKEAIISNEIPEDMLKTMIEIVQLHGNKCDTISAASNSYDGSTFNLKCNLYRYSYNFVDKGGEWHFEVEK